MGCRVYRFLKLPLQHEVEYELTAHYRNGLAFNAAMHDPAYGPGSKSIHQWRLLVDAAAEPILAWLRVIATHTFTASGHRRAATSVRQSLVHRRCGAGLSAGAAGGAPQSS
jgi:hypothetical protein